MFVRKIISGYLLRNWNHWLCKIGKYFKKQISYAKMHFTIIIFKFIIVMLCPHKLLVLIVLYLGWISLIITFKEAALRFSILLGRKVKSCELQLTQNLAPTSDISSQKYAQDAYSRHETRKQIQVILFIFFQYLFEIKNDILKSRV